MQDERCGRGIKIITSGGFALRSRHILDLKNKNRKMAVAEKTVPVFYVPKRKTLLKELFLRGIEGGVVLLLSRLAILAKRYIAPRAKNIKGLIVARQNRVAGKSAINFNFAPPGQLSRGLAAFILVAFVFALPLKVFSSFEELQKQKDHIVQQGFSGYNALRNNDFIGAGISFASAKKTMDDLNFALKCLLSAIPGAGEKLNVGSNLILFGENFSNAARLIQEAVNFFDEKKPVVDKIRHLRLKIRQATPYLLAANRTLDNLSGAYSFLPADLSFIRQALNDGTKALLVFEDFSDTLLDILGDKHFKRYLFIFQNNNEIRATGGFMGSFAVIDIDKGEIKQMEIPGGGTYDVKGQLRELVISPEPLHLINSAWQFQDSNWFPDFPESAKKMMWFYEKSGGPSVDGVVAVNASLMADILRIVGPVDMPEYGRTVAADNFIEETQKIVELEYDKTKNKPKQFIADMAPRVLEKLFEINAKDVSALSDMIHHAILNKDILVYSRDNRTEKKLEDFGLAGKLRDISDFTDYLMLIDTNIAGQKTDGKILREIEHFSEIAEDGTITDTVKITRRHTGEKGALFSGVRNVNYLRLYVPLNSKLISAQGFEAPSGHLFKSVKDGYSSDRDLWAIQGAVYVDPKSGMGINNEFGRTVFGNWIMVDPGQEATVIIKYELPNKLESRTGSGIKKVLGLGSNFMDYRMLIEKQAGAKNTRFKGAVSAKNKGIVARVGAGVALQDNGWQYDTSLDGDKYYGVILEDRFSRD